VVRAVDAVCHLVRRGLPGRWRTGALEPGRAVGCATALSRRAAAWANAVDIWRNQRPSYSALDRSAVVWLLGPVAGAAARPGRAPGEIRPGILADAAGAHLHRHHVPAADRRRVGLLQRPGARGEHALAPRTAVSGASTR